MTKFLSNQEVLTKLGVEPGKVWQSCNYTVNSMFRCAQRLCYLGETFQREGRILMMLILPMSIRIQLRSADWMKDFQYTIPALLANGTRVLIYAGDVGASSGAVGKTRLLHFLPATHECRPHHALALFLALLTRQTLSATSLATSSGLLRWTGPVREPLSRRVWPPGAANR